MLETRQTINPEEVGQKENQEQTFSDKNVCPVCGLSVDGDYDHSQCQEKQGRQEKNEKEKFSTTEQAELDAAWADIKKFDFSRLEEIDPKFHFEIALKLIEARYPHLIFENLNKFQNLDYQEIALKLIENKYYKFLAENLNKFPDMSLDEKIAQSLTTLGVAVLLNIKKFKNIDQKEIFFKVIDVNGRAVASNIDKIDCYDYKEIVLQLINKRHTEYVIENLEKFPDMSLDEEVAIKLFSSREFEMYVLLYIDKFKNINVYEIVLKVIEKGRSDLVANNLEKCQGLDHSEIALKIIYEEGAGVFLKYIDKFDNLNQEVLLLLVQYSHGKMFFNDKKAGGRGGRGRMQVDLKKFEQFRNEVVLLKIIETGHMQNIDNFQEEVGNLDFKKEIDKSDLKKMRPFFQSLCKNFQLNTYSQVKIFIEQNNRYYEYLLSANEDQFLNREDLVEINRLMITWAEAEEIKAEGHSLKEIDFDELFEELKRGSEFWKDEQNIVKPFEGGIKIFGVEKMFKFLNRPWLSRHDGLHAFNKIIELQQASGLMANEFYGNILEQVKADGAEYESGTAHHELNSIAQSIDLQIEDNLLKAKEYKEIELLQELIETLKTSKEVFSSWNNLKRYSKLVELLSRTEILDQLKELKLEGNYKLYKYLETLAFHPSSKVEMEKVFEFWKEPEKFLMEDDTHTPTEVHDRKKPSNYVHIPHLDLTAEQLRDALVEGKMDQLQAFNPMEIEYRIPLKQEYPTPTRDKLKLALGSFKEKIKGKAEDPKKLFSEVKKVFKKHDIDFQGYLKGVDLPEDKREEVENEVSKILDDPKIGLKGEDEQVFVAKINRKSDPNGVLAGNDTGCCMPFGSGKNTVYTFNPDTSLFTLQIKRPDGNLRTIAQSVLTKDKDLHQLLPEVIKKMQNIGEKISDIVSEDVLIETQSYLACDNVEVAPNFRGGQYPVLIEKIYRDFFQEYMRHFAKDQALNTDFMPIGKGYSETMKHLPERPNTFVPLAPVGYTDTVNAGNLDDEIFHTVYSIDLNEAQEKLKRKVVVPEVSKQEQPPLPKIKGLKYLTFQDSLAVAYLEGKAYSDNNSLMQYLHNMENGLIAKDINNVDKGRPNMCLKYTDSKGKIRSYMLVYEGVIGEGYKENEYDEEEEDRDEAGERILYISDFASDKESPMASGKLLKGFTELYRQNYLEKGNLVPIYAEAREQTSYRLIQRQIEKIGKDLGIEVELEELPTYQAGDDTMHPVMIRAKKAA